MIEFGPAALAVICAVVTLVVVSLLLVEVLRNNRREVLLQSVLHEVGHRISPTLRSGINRELGRNCP